VKQNTLQTPFGTVTIYKNGKKIDFTAEIFDESVCLEDNTIKKPEGSYKLNFDTTELKAGDIIICKFNAGSLQCDGGSESTINIVGTYKGYTIGMGTYCTQEIDYEKKFLPYETYEYRKRGFEAHILDDFQNYPHIKSLLNIYFVVAWEKGTADDEWDLVSYITSQY